MSSSDEKLSSSFVGEVALSAGAGKTPSDVDRVARLPNDEYAWIDSYAADLHKAAKELVAEGEAARVSDEAIAQILTAAVRLYYAKSELENRPVPAIVREGPQTITPTEMLVTVSEMLRDVRLGPMELGLWFRRRPGEN